MLQDVWESGREGERERGREWASVEGDFGIFDK
jgi:hypothetical protein